MRMPGKSMAATMMAAVSAMASMGKFKQQLGRYAATPAMPQLPGFLSFPHRTGPGRKTLDTHHKKIGRSCYRPHQGSQERLRRWKQMEKQRGDA